MDSPKVQTPGTTPQVGQTHPRGLKPAHSDKFCFFNCPPLKVRRRGGFPPSPENPVAHVATTSRVGRPRPLGQGSGSRLPPSPPHTHPCSLPHPSPFPSLPSRPHPQGRSPVLHHDGRLSGVQQLLPVALSLQVNDLRFATPPGELELGGSGDPSPHPPPPCPPSPFSLLKGGGEVLLDALVVDEFHPTVSGQVLHPPAVPSVLHVAPALQVLCKSTTAPPWSPTPC